MEDKVQHQATVCSFVWVSTVSPPLLQSRNLDLDREQTWNSNGELTLKCAEVRTVLSWRGDGTEARSPCSLEYTGWHGQRGPVPGGLQTGRLISEEVDGFIVCNVRETSPSSTNWSEMALTWTAGAGSRWGRPSPTATWSSGPRWPSSSSSSLLSLSSWWWSAAGLSPAGPGAQGPEWEDSPARGLLVQQG